MEALARSRAAHLLRSHCRRSRRHDSLHDSAAAPPSKRMAPLQPPGPPEPAVEQLGELQRAVADLQRAALDSEQQLAGARAAATEAEAEVRGQSAGSGSFFAAAPATAYPTRRQTSHPAARPYPQAALVVAYGRRLQRLAALLQQYDAQLHRALAALGVTQQQRGQQPREQQQQDAQPSTDALAALAAGLQQLEQQIVTAVEGSPAELLSPEALLGLGSGTDLAAAAAAAGPTAILQALQGVAMAPEFGMALTREGWVFTQGTHAMSPSRELC